MMFAINHHKNDQTKHYTCHDKQPLAAQGELKNPNNDYVLKPFEVEAYNGYTKEYNRLTWRADKEFILDQRHAFFVGCGVIRKTFTVNFDLAREGSVPHESFVLESEVVRYNCFARGLAQVVKNVESLVDAVKQVRNRHPAACNFRNLKEC